MWRIPRTLTQLTQTAVVILRAAHRLLVVLVALKTQEAVAAQLMAAIVLAALNTSKLGGEDVKVLRRFAC